MRLGLITDATCDLPAQLFKRHDIEVLPITVKLGETSVLDERDPSVTLRFHRGALASAGRPRVIEDSAAQLRVRFLDRVVLRYDYVFCITPDAAHDSLHENATKAAFAILDDYPALRRHSGAQLPFALRVIDSQTQSAGLGLLVAEAGRTIEEGGSPAEIAAHLDRLRPAIRSYFLPSDPSLSRGGGSRAEVWQVGGVVAGLGRRLRWAPIIRHRSGAAANVVACSFDRRRAIARLFSIAAEGIVAGLLCPRIVISYGGDVRDIAQLPGYDRLAETARRHGVELLPAIMSATTGLALGAGGINLAMATV